MQIINNEINGLAISNNIINPNAIKPSGWYSLKWSGKWIAFLLLSIIITCILFNQSPKNPGVIAFIIIGIIFIIISLVNIFVSLNRNTIALRQYNDTISWFDYSCSQENKRIVYESEIKNDKKNQLNELTNELEKYIQNENELQKLLKSTKNARELLYAVNYIPYQFRNLKSIGFFYSQVQSSPIVLNELIRYEPEHVSNGYNSIPGFIKIQDDMSSFLTLNNYFWSSCSTLTKKIDKYISEKDEQSLEQKMQNLIDTINEEGLGMKNIFNASVGAVTEKNIGTISVTTPLSDYQPSVEADADREILKQIIEDLTQKIMQSNRGDIQELLEKLNELRPQLEREKPELRAVWWERIKDGLEAFANVAGVAGFALASYTQFGP